MSDCKSNGGIKAIYLTEVGGFTLTPGKELKPYISEIKPKPRELKQIINYKILSPGMKKMVKWLEQEIKSCEGTAEEYFQELDNPEMGEQELAKAEALKSVIKYITEKL